MANYFWEIQRQTHGFWSHHAPVGEPFDPYGREDSDLSPQDFARAVLLREKPVGRRRVAVWEGAALPGSAPVAVLESTEVRRG